MSVCQVLAYVSHVFFFLIVVAPVDCFRRKNEQDVVDIWSGQERNAAEIDRTGHARRGGGSDREVCTGTLPGEVYEEPALGEWSIATLQHVRGGVRCNNPASGFCTAALLWTTMVCKRRKPYLVLFAIHGFFHAKGLAVVSMRAVEINAVKYGQEVNMDTAVS